MKYFDFARAYQKSKWQFIGLWHRLRLYLPIRNLQKMPAFLPYLALLTGDTNLDIVGEMSFSLLETPSFAKAVDCLHSGGDKRPQS